jgi:2'-5' RNA ligase
MSKDTQKLYFIAVVPQEDIRSEVTGFKHYIAEHFNSRHSLKSPPHITLQMPFKWKEEKENKLVKFLGDFSSTQIPFEVALKNFSAFPKRVIYIDIVKNEYLEKLYFNLSSAIRKELKIINDSYKNQGFTPHMTIAHRDLKPAAFDMAWAEFKEKPFDKKFLVDHICLLKHNGKSWDIFERFSFYGN